MVESCRSFRGGIVTLDLPFDAAQHGLMTIQDVSQSGPVRLVQAPEQVTFDRRELTQIMGVYGRMVAAGEWRDYAL